LHHNSNNNQKSYSNPSSEATNAAYNNLKDLTSVQNPSLSGGTSGASTTNTYGYDGLNRLTEVTGTETGANSWTYTYDKNGNITQTFNNGSYSASYITTPTTN
jgi:YD repeat-containing protein